VYFQLFPVSGHRGDVCGLARPGCGSGKALLLCPRFVAAVRRSSRGSGLLQQSQKFIPIDWLEKVMVATRLTGQSPVLCRSKSA
jgi:hypothetical protein